jgi:enamine deaminase RidA (YjgF/YER057c/UK114 family)
MIGGAENRLRELGLELPAPRPPAGNYVPFTRAGDLVYLAGQGSTGFHGRLGEDLDVEAGQAAAQSCMLNLLSQAHVALAALDRVGHVVKVNGFVCCTADFADHPAVLDGATNLLVELFGDQRGRPARSAIGVYALPKGFAVEIEMIVST